MPFSFQRKTSAPYLHVDVSALFWFWVYLDVSLDVFFLLSTIVRLDSSTSRPRLFYVSYVFIVELRFSKYEPRHPRRAQGERREAETLPEIKETGAYAGGLKQSGKFRPEISVRNSTLSQTLPNTLPTRVFLGIRCHFQRTIERKHSQICSNSSIMTSITSI